MMLCAISHFYRLHLIVVDRIWESHSRDLRNKSVYHLEVAAFNKAICVNAIVVVIWIYAAYIVFN